MDNRLQKGAVDFIANLTGATEEEIREYTGEIRSNHRFHNSLEKKRNSHGRKDSFWYYGIGKTLGEVLYIICRLQKPENVIETGVASGISSSHFLCALEANGRGQLYSIDLPAWNRNMSGWMIPDYLRQRWHLIQGRSSDTMVPLLKEIKEIDVFFHDSDHSYENMTLEFEAAWAYLKSGGILLSHNIDYSDAFVDFYRKYSVKGITLGSMGGIIKN